MVRVWDADVPPDFFDFEAVAAALRQAAQRQHQAQHALHRAAAAALGSPSSSNGGGGFGRSSGSGGGYPQIDAGREYGMPPTRPQ